jgi:hypothetical protein
LGTTLTYSIVLSGPARHRTAVQRALSELNGITYLLTERDYGLEHKKDEKFITVEGDCDVSLPDSARAMNRANSAVEQYGWRLRMHGEKPEEPEPRESALEKLFKRVEALEASHGLGGPTMTLESPAAFNQASNYPAEQSRRAWFFPIATTGGVKGAGDLAPTAPGSGLSINNGTGELIIPGTESTTQGLYYGRCSATQNTSVSTASGSNPRIDTVCATVSDSGYTEPSGGSGDKWSIQVVAGTPTSGATLSNLSGVASLPASSLLLCYILVPTSASNIITADIGDARIFASVAGQKVNGTDSGWLTIANGSMSNSWVNNSGSNPAIAYRLQGNRVQWRGGINSGTNGQTPFTVPAGFRPAVNSNFFVSGNGSSNEAFVSIAATGVVNPTATVATIDGIDFSSITYTVD